MCKICHSNTFVVLFSIVSNIDINHKYYISLKICSSGVDKRIILWDIPEARSAAEFNGHTDTVYSLRFSRDGHILASGWFPFSVLDFC